MQTLGCYEVPQNVEGGDEPRRAGTASVPAPRCCAGAAPAGSVSSLRGSSPIRPPQLLRVCLMGPEGRQVTLLSSSPKYWSRQPGAQSLQTLLCCGTWNVCLSLSFSLGPATTAEIPLLSPSESSGRERVPATLVGANCRRRAGLSERGPPSGQPVTLSHLEEKPER